MPLKWTPGTILWGLLIVLFLGAAGFVYWLLWNYTVDDAYITMRYARNFAGGHGIVFNPGGPAVEGFSNPSLFLFQTLAIVLGIPPLPATKFLGSLCGLGIVLTTALFARDILRWSLPEDEDISPILPAAVLGPGLLAVSPGIAAISVMGLEGSLFGFSIALGSWLSLKTWRGEWGWFAPAGAGLALAFAVWTRPEGIAWAVGWSAAVGCLILRFDRPRWRKAALLAGVAIGSWLLLIVLRLAIFGDFFPNPYYMKTAGSLADRLAGGLGSVTSWILTETGWLWLILALAGALLGRRARAEWALIWLAIGGHFAVTGYLGADWMPHLRFLSPGLALPAVGASTGLALIINKMKKRPTGRLFPFLAAAICMAVVAGFFLHNLFKTKGILAEIQTRIYGWQDAHKPLAEWLLRWNLKRDEPLTVALEDIGLIGWVSRARIIDLAGLTEPKWARQVFREGHEAVYPVRELVEEERPEVIVLVGTGRDANHQMTIAWFLDRTIAGSPLFRANYDLREIFYHKDFPLDGYYLLVFMRNDVVGEAPPVTVPTPRARGGWE